MSQSPSPPRSARSSADATTGEPTSGVVDQAQGTISQLADQAQSTAGQVTDQAKQQATSQVESQKERAVDTLVTVAQALRQTGQQLHQQDQGAVGGYVDQAAERVESLTNHLRARDVSQLIAETQDFARRQPGLFLMGAVALGFVGARFLMSSGQRAAAQQFPGPDPSYPPSYGQYGQVGAFESSAGTAAYMHSTPPMPRVPSPAGSSAMPATSGYASAEAPHLTGTDRPYGVPPDLEA
jgi:hypothetical protein